MSTKEEVFSYVMNTPGNTNPAVLKSLLDGMEGGSLWDGTATGLSEGSGDVTVSYNGAVLGSLSDTGTATLKTENTIVQDDIEVEYTKPEGESDFPSLNIDVSNASGIFDEVNLIAFAGLKKHRTLFMTDKWVAISNALTATHYVPAYDSRGSNFTITGKILSDTDKYNVTINNFPVDYAVDGYNLYGFVNGYNTNVSIVITDKAGN